MPTGVYKHKPHSEKWKRKMSKKLKGRKRPTPWLVGKKYSKVHCEKIAKAKIGSKNPMWKGKKVKYRALHQWIRRNFGSPEFCENKKCTKKCKRYQWTNISGKYRRDRKDWKRLCMSCHYTFDFNRNDKRHREMKKRWSKQMLGNNNGFKKGNNFWRLRKK